MATENTAHRHGDELPDVLGSSRHGMGDSLASQTSVVQPTHSRASGYRAPTENVASATAVNNSSTADTTLSLQHYQPSKPTRNLPQKNDVGAEVARIVRAALLRDALAAVAEWQRATGADRAWCRRYALTLLRRFKAEHAIPERRAFEAAVAASRQRTAA